MKKTVAVVVGLVVVLSCVATCGGLYLWLQANRDELTRANKESLRTGADFGEGKDGVACVAEAERRLHSVDGLIAEASNKVFLEACLQIARLPPGFCDGVPPRGELRASAAWLQSSCTGVDAPDRQRCTRLLGAVQERCERRTR